jgi:acyl-ACP thioesterase
MKEWTWTDEYLISSYEVDAGSRLPLYSMTKYLQETAYNHADHLEFGYAQLKEKNLFWVLSRLLIRVDRYPGWGDRIQVRTWPAGIESLFAFRDFRVLDEEGAPIGAAGSAWLVLDAGKRRPQRQDALKEKSPLFPLERALEERPGKIHTLSDAEEGPPFPVRYSDLDLYNHVNNSKYIQWILDSYPGEMHREFEVALFEINFLSEAKMGDKISIHTETGEGSDPLLAPAFRHSIKRESDNRDICLARAIWKKKQEVES